MPPVDQRACTAAQRRAPGCAFHEGSSAGGITTTSHHHHHTEKMSNGQRRPLALLAALTASLAAAQAVDFEEHSGMYCGHEPELDKEHNCGALRSKPFPNPCWAYWSDTDTLEQCKDQCVKLQCPCLGYLAADTGYFHKCRIVAPDGYSGKLIGSSTGFMAVTTSGAFPLLTDPRQGAIGWAVICGFLAYVIGGVAHGHVVRKKRRWEALPHIDQWRQLVALAKDGAAFSRSRFRSRKAAPDSRTPLRSASRADSDAAVERERDTRAAKKSKKGKKERNPKRSGDVADGEVTRATAELPQQARPDAATASPTSQVLVEKREGAVHTSQQKVKVVSLLANSDVS